MFVAVHHTISDPSTFWGAVRQAADALPDGLALHHCLPRSDGREAMCIWEADSVGTVRNFVEEGVGSASTNEYCPVEHREGVHLPSSMS